MAWEAWPDEPGSQPYLHFVQVDIRNFSIETQADVFALWSYLAAVSEEFPQLIPVWETGKGA